MEENTAVVVAAAEMAAEVMVVKVEVMVVKVVVMEAIITIIIMPKTITIMTTKASEAKNQKTTDQPQINYLTILADKLDLEVDVGLFHHLKKEKKVIMQMAQEEVQVSILLDLLLIIWSTV
jgi:hypothetical protein